MTPDSLAHTQADILSDTDIANHTLAIANNDQNEQVHASTAVVRELACLDLQKEMRYKLAKATTSSSGVAGGMMQEGGGGIALRRELVANVLSLVMLRPTSSTDETGSSSSNSQAAVGYLALLGDAILVLNQVSNTRMKVVVFKPHFFSRPFSHCILFST